MNYIYSYAQNYEDIMLWRALKHIDNGFYIDIGAAWPVFDSVTKLFYDKNWRGINVEPNPQLFHAFEAERVKDINVNAAISSDVNQSQFFVIGETGLSTADQTFADAYVEKGIKIDTINIKFLTLNQLWDQYIGTKEVHFLKIDVEGLELSIIKSNNWIKNRPWIVVVEATLPMSQEASYKEWEHIFLEHDYLFAYQDGLNRFYVATEHKDLLKAFASPPNVFDHFIKYNLNNEKDNEISLLRTQRDSLKNSYDRIIMSTSWKITAPFRKITQFLCYFMAKMKNRTNIQNS